ncbi:MULTISPECIES: DUF6152 family protein [unclassified Novosphingobium]|uniref:DUF6152 family protein n=1 Tax=unclassified Novosphingobium TaxID=2644732 RepID=UPI000A619ED3|nr:MULTISPECIES: DUF6152 family protein [unclassified Novosphingobium]MDR6707563.1 hypothetical protein [Novosphingobium sp. 1748]NKI98074.1 hypothetical protein [Novosphingobium sp. SG707]
MTKKLCSAILWATAMIAAQPAAAHHSFAMFDQTKQVELDGMLVTKFTWTNPHAFVMVQSGQTTYALECSSPNLMTHAGWNYQTLKAGDKVDIVFYPLRNGKPGGMLKTVKLADGKVLSGW